MEHTKPGRGRMLAILVAAVTLPAMAGCQTRGDVTGSIYPHDHAERHPIVLSDGARVLDLFVEGSSGLSPRSRLDLAGFADEYRRFGTGRMLVQVPSGPGTNPNTSRAVEAVRGGVGGSISLQTYQPTDASVASPVRLTFKRLQAKVGSQCGLWPDDLGVSDAAAYGKNEQYWNFGCAAQANLASQVADPNDLVRGRPETRSDTGRRMYNIQQLRTGNDPSTNWKQDSSSVTSGVSQ